jgi:acylphosphatase
MIIHKNITVKGRVQGVWFRASTREAAIRIGVKGIVKNLPNGDVYIEAEGTPEQLTSFITWCRQGSRLANVTAIEEQPGDLTDYTDFVIR